MTISRQSCLSSVLLCMFCTTSYVVMTKSVLSTQDFEKEQRYYFGTEGVHNTCQHYDMPKARLASHGKINSNSNPGEQG
jgi:hypothetical protein